MAATVDTVYQAALNLTDAARLELVEKLIPTIVSAPEHEAEQLRVVRQRAHEIDSGLVQPVDSEDVFRRVEQSLASRRGE